MSVIGCGYLGAVHAASMVELGHSCVGVDVDADAWAEDLAATLPHELQTDREPPLDEPGGLQRHELAEGW